MLVKWESNTRASFVMVRDLGRRALPPSVRQVYDFGKDCHDCGSPSPFSPRPAPHHHHHHVHLEFLGSLWKFSRFFRSPGGQLGCFSKSYFLNVFPVQVNGSPRREAKGADEACWRTRHHGGESEYEDDAVVAHKVARATRTPRTQTHTGRQTRGDPGGWGVSRLKVTGS